MASGQFQVLAVLNSGEASSVFIEKELDWPQNGAGHFGEEMHSRFSIRDSSTVKSIIEMTA